jgi:hypothetical protein
MKKLLATLTLCAFMTTFAVANSNYKLNEDAVQQQFQQAETVVWNTASADALDMTNIAIPSGDKSVGGFLLRWFVCGALLWSHRKYMGTGGESVWYWYCIPVYGSVLACGEFIDVLFGGDDALSKYSGNGAACVWCGN